MAKYQDRKPEIIVVGSINMDLVVRAPHIPVPGETVLGMDFGTFPGGKGANQAVAAARQGASVTLIGCVGSDDFGYQLVEGLGSEGVNIKHVKADEHAPTGVALITLDEAGENSIVVASGANHKLSPQDIQDAKTVFSGADVLLLQLESPIEAVIEAAELAKGYGMKVILNPAPAQNLPAELLFLVDVLIPNQSETALLTGLPINTLDHIEIAARNLLDRGVGCVVVTIGENGALIVNNDSPTTHVPGIKVEVVDTTAAGDSFVGASAVALADGLSFKDAVERGCAAGALAANRMGAQPSIPTETEVDGLLEG